MFFLLKVLLSAVIIATVSELARRSTTLAALLASLPLTSLLAILWFYYETRDGRQAAALAENIFWALLPSLLFFLAFPLLLRTGWRFGTAMGAAVLIMVAGYLTYVWILGKIGIRF